ncbi:MAG: TonB-dependent receptor [Sphingomonadaceae bacterium PASS1]|nr:MAG: TonB-dependent receptor [Sphingomonadaceae bacterium PASS1]
MLFNLFAGLFAITLFTSASFASTSPPADQMSPEAAGELGKVSIVVTGRATDLIGSATAASEGIVGKVDLDDRPIQRIAELLEVIPGFIATQHSGGGKANQYFLRGFNLDHGTDFAAFHDGVPVNMRTHGHGQGYLDLSFVIPELVESVSFAKGPYRAENGDFATAGAARFKTVDTLDAPFAKAEIGAGDYNRFVAAGSTKLAAGDVLLGVEARYDDGPYDLSQKVRLFSGFAKWTGPLGGGTLRASATGYRVDFRSSEQIPLRAIESGRIGRFGFFDDDLGGETTRIGAVLNWTDNSPAPLNLLAYAHHYDFRLTSNFTYFLDNPVDGDEFEQRDRRTVVGGRIDKRFDADVVVPIEVLVGAEGRYDFVDRVGLYRTASRQVLSTVREDEVNERSAAMFAEVTVRPMSELRAMLGARVDAYRFDVDADLAANSGEDSAAIFSPKASIAYTPFEQIEFYANYGRGFHSNDARGTSINIDPNTGGGADRVDALVAGTGYEGGVRARPLPGLTLTGTYWWLDLASELLFIGDGGTTEAQGPSKRRGFELGAFYQPAPWLTIDTEYTKSRGRLSDLPDAGNWIPGAIEEVIAGGFVAKYKQASLTMRLRHFGSYSLIEDNSVRADPLTIINARAKYQIGSVELAADLLNVFDAKDNEIEYFYASRLPGEPAGGIEDRHVRPIEPRQLRVSAKVTF